jgi:hypothetical protein
MKRLLLIALTVCGFCAQSFSAGPNLIVNGDFESDAVASGSYTRVTTTNGISSWWVGSHNGLFYKDVDLVGENYPGMPSGNATQYIDLCGQNSGIIRQDFATTSGASYTLSFSYAKNERAGSAAATHPNTFGAYAFVRVSGATQNRQVGSLRLLSPYYSTLATVDTNLTTALAKPNTWSSTNITFTAVSTRTEVEFFSDQNSATPPSGGILIDDVSVVAN